MTINPSNAQFIDGQLFSNGTAVKSYHESVGQWLFPLAYQFRQKFRESEEGKIKLAKRYKVLAECDQADAQPGLVPDSIQAKAYQRLMANEDLTVAEQHYGVASGGIGDIIDRVLSDGSLLQMCMTKGVNYTELTIRLNVQAHMFEAANPDIKVPNLYMAHITDKGTVTLQTLRRFDDDVVPHILAAYDKLEDPEGILDALQEEMPESEKEMALGVLKHQMIIEKFKQKDGEAKKAIMEAMAKRGQRDYRDGDLHIVRTCAYEKPSISVVEVRKKYPEVFDDLGKWIKVGESLRISVGKGTEETSDEIE